MPPGFITRFDGVNGLSARLAENLDVVMDCFIHPVMDKYHVGAALAGLLGVIVLIRIFTWVRAM